MRSTTRRLTSGIAATALVLAVAAPVAADNHQAMVRVLHASFDAPNVDVYVDDNAVLTDVPFKALSDYLALDAGDYQIKVTPAGDADTAVIDAPVTVEGGQKYTIAAIGPVAEIQPKVLVDGANPSSDGTQVRIVHFSPDAGPVDVAPDGGDALVSGLEYPNDTGYVDLPADAYDLEVRAAGTDTVALDLPEVNLEAGTAYSVFAVGSAEGGSLDVVIGVDAMATPSTDTVGSTAGNGPAWALVAAGIAAIVAALGALRLAPARIRR